MHVCVCVCVCVYGCVVCVCASAGVHAPEGECRGYAACTYVLRSAGKDASMHVCTSMYMLVFMYKRVPLHRKALAVRREGEGEREREERRNCSCVKCTCA